MPFNGILATVSDVFVKDTNPMAAQKCSSFHFSGFFRDWIQLATLLATSPLRSSACVSTTVRDPLSNYKFNGDKATFIFPYFGIGS